MIKRTYSVGVVIYEGNTVLLVKLTEYARLPTGSYGFPAGRVEEGEEPDEAACRELLEETGYQTSPEFLERLCEKTSTLPLKNGSENFVFIPYLCTKYWGESRPSQKTVPEFVPLDQLDDLQLVSPDVRAISRENYRTADKK